VSLNVYSQDGAPVSSRHGKYQALEPWRLYEFIFGNLPPGNYTVVITVTDSAGATKVVRSALTVFPELKLSATGPLTDVDAGQLVTFRARAVGGAPPVSVSWYVNGTLVSQGESLSYTFPAPGVYVVTAVATDSLGVKTSSQVKVTAVPALTANLTLSVQGRPLGQPPRTLRVDEGIPLGLNVVTEGGVPPIAVAWYANGSPIGQGNSIEIPFSEPGTYEVVAVVRDGANYTVSKTFTVVVVTPPKVYVRALNASGSAFVYNATATLIPGVTGGVNATAYVYLNGQLVGKFSPAQPVTLNLAMGDNVVKIVAVDQYGLNSTYVLTIPSGYAPTFYGAIGGAAAAGSVIALALLKRRK
jgi:PKD repeat protein